MKKLIKYINENSNETLETKLNTYNNQVKHVLSSSTEFVVDSVSHIPLSRLAPLAAASLTSIGLSAQCGVGVFSPSNSVVAPDAGGGPNDMTIDVDGDGTIDFELDALSGGGGGPENGDLFIDPKNGAEVLGSNVGGFFMLLDLIQERLLQVLEAYGKMLAS